MRKNLDNIEIVEPPIEELTKKRSWKGACFTSLLLLILLGVGVVVGLKFYIGPGPKIGHTIPDNFPKDIPIYDKDNIESITYITARYKARGIGMASLFPKLLLSPIFNSNEANKDKNAVGDEFWKSFSNSEKNYGDSIQIQWSDVDANPNFVASYYKKEMLKKNFIIDLESEGKGIRQFSFSREDGVSGSILAQSATNSGGTTYILLTVNLPK